MNQQEQNEKSAVAVAQNDISTIKDVVEEIKKGQSELRKFVEEKLSELDKKYVTKEEFWPVKTIVYGGAGLVLSSVLGLIIALALKK